MPRKVLPFHNYEFYETMMISKKNFFVFFCFFGNSILYGVFDRYIYAYIPYL